MLMILIKMIKFNKKILKITQIYKVLSNKITIKDSLKMKFKIYNKNMIFNKMITNEILQMIF